MAWICSNCFANGKRVVFANVAEVTQHLWEVHIKDYDQTKENLDSNPKKLMTLLEVAEKPFH